MSELLPISLEPAAAAANGLQFHRPMESPAGQVTAPAGALFDLHWLDATQNPSTGALSVSGTATLAAPAGVGAAGVAGDFTTRGSEHKLRRDSEHPHLYGGSFLSAAPRLPFQCPKSPASLPCPSSSRRLSSAAPSVPGDRPSHRRSGYRLGPQRWCGVLDFRFRGNDTEYRQAQCRFHFTQARSSIRGGYWIASSGRTLIVRRVGHGAKSAPGHPCPAGR